jgi:hypothetical protein
VSRAFFPLLLLLPLSLFAAGRDVSAVRYAPSDSSAGSPAVAFNGNRFLTLWPMSLHIYGSLADPASGTMQAAFPVVPFASANALQLTPAGGGYLAIWNQQDLPSLSTLTSEGVFERSVRIDVTKLNAPRLAFNGSHILIVDQITTPPGAIGVSLYDLSGALVRRFPLPVFINESYAVTETAGQFAVVTAGRSGVNEWRVANDGTIVSTLQILPPPTNPFLSVYNVAVTSKSGSIAIAWLQLQLGTLSSAVIQPNGTVTQMSLPNGGVPPAIGLAIVPVNVGFVIAWSVRPSPPDNPGVLALRINDGGASLDARPTGVGDGTLSATASSGNAIEIAVITPPNPPSTLIATVDANGISPRPETSIAVTAVRQSVPVVTGSGSSFTAAWLDQSAGFRGSVAGRVSRDGEPLDGSGRNLGLSSFSSPAIAQGSSGALVVWGTSDSIVAARLTQFGEVLDATPILIAKQQFPESFALAWDGNRYFVVWTNGIQLLGAFVGPDGAVTIAKPLTNNQAVSLNDLSLPDVAWDGRQFIVVFGEVSFEVFCDACLPPIADHVRIMRVSANGDAIDVVPLLVPGVHFRAHVASSGAESIIALDSASDTSTMIVRVAGGVLQLDPEVPLFHWFTEIFTDVAWNGNAYVVGWRYVPATATGAGWLGASQVSQSGLALGSLFIEAGLPDFSSASWVPSVAANDMGEVALVISEMAPPSYVARARLYLMSELAPMPPVPPAPRNVVSYLGGSSALIQWQSDGAAESFVLEESRDFGQTWFLALVVGNVNNATVPASVGNLFRVSAFGPGGVSAGTVTSIGSMQRHHAQRP